MPDLDFLLIVPDTLITKGDARAALCQGRTRREGNEKDVLKVRRRRRRSEKKIHAGLASNLQAKIFARNPPTDDPIATSSLQILLVLRTYRHNELASVPCA